jgi:hypothetical protein
MAVVFPFLPVLAALSSEAQTMQQAGFDDGSRETHLQSLLVASDTAASGIGGPEESGMLVAAVTTGETATADVSITGDVSAEMAETAPDPRTPAQIAAEDAAKNSQSASPEPAPATDPVLLTEGAINADEALIDGRRRPGDPKRLPDPVRQTNKGAVRPPPPEAFPGDNEFPVPDRWRLSQTLGVARKERFLDPYNQNQFKGDIPLCIPTEEEQERRAKEGIKPCKTPKFLGLTGDDWFLPLTGISDTIIEPRSFPTPVGVQTTARPGSNDVFGRSRSEVYAQTFLFGGSLIKGSTAFKPQDVEYRILLALNANYVDINERRVLKVEPSKPTHRFDHFLGVQELFFEKHRRNVSDRFDFDSVRIGIQPFQADFRGFLFNDNQLGIRFFGNRDNNRYQYNLALFFRLEKDTNSGLNSVVQTPRRDVTFFANLYRQDFPFVGLTSQISATVNINRDGNRTYIDKNGFPARPALLGTLRGRNYDVAYLGYALDGHIGRVNLTAQAYAALGEDRASFFNDRKAKIRSFFFAAEPSMDFNWVRVRLAGLYASGDHDPYDKTETGFDAVFENPIFAGADTSYWIRQVIPFAGGGRAVGVNTRNGVLANLRSSKEEGQSNFNNPGTILVGAGMDFDITPRFRLSTNVNHLWFENTSTIQALRVEGSIPKSIGWDVSAAAIYRPKAIQNVVFRLSGALLDPGKGFDDLFSSAGRDKRFYSVLFNAILSY